MANGKCGDIQVDCRCSRTIGFNTRTFHRTMLGLTVLIVLFLCDISSAQNMKIDVDRMINTFEMDKQVPRKVDNVPVSLMWGIADTSATVGRLFNYAIPSDAFKGNIHKFKVTEAGKDTLPQWLSFQEENRVLKGIPSPSDHGQIYVEVITLGHDNSKAQDVFTITVANESPSNYVPPPQPITEGSKPRTIRCRRELPETAVSVVLDADLTNLPTSSKIGILEKTSQYLNLNNDMFKLLPAGIKPVVDNTALVAGPGNAKTSKHPGVILSWNVGCGKVEKDHMPILHLVESSSVNGSLSEELGHNIVGWHVTNTPQVVIKRKRRAIRATATAALTPSPPTKVPDGVKDTSEPLMRSVPVMGSPTFTPMIQPTKSVLMPSASPGTPGKPDVMMTAVPEPGTPSPKPGTIDTTKTQILPTRTYTMTDAPTVRPGGPNCPMDGQPRPPIVKDVYKTQVFGSFYFTAGSLSKYTLPRDLFFDCKDQGMENLKLNLFFSGRKSPPDNYWLVLKYDQRKMQWLATGLPMESDEGRKKFIVTAINSEGLTASAEVIVTVLTRKGDSKPPNHKISLVLDANFKEFDIHDRIAVSNKIAKLYGDKDIENIKVLGIEEGSVVYSYTNDSLSDSDKCPVTEIHDLTKKLLRDDNTLKPKALRMMEPYVLEGVAVKPMGSCEGHSGFPHKNIRKEKPPTPEPEPEVTSDKGYNIESTSTESSLNKGAQEGDDDDEVWITTVVPALVIVAILLIALLIACILYRKKRKGKMSLEDKNTFVNKGAPVIFPDEFDEKTPNESTKPLIMEDEKPPMPPPEYTRASSESSRSSDNKNDQEEIEEHEMDETDVNSPLYRPPPPVPISGGNKTPRPHVQPAYKNTDPAILP